MAEDKKYTGKAVEVCVLSQSIDVDEGMVQDVYGVSCMHVVEKIKGEDTHLMVAKVPDQLAKEMVSTKRAHLLSDIKKIDVQE